MPIETVEINDSQCDSILVLVENHFIDHKAIEVQPSKLSRSVSAFANADGGELYVGITDNGKWIGFPSIEDANAHLQTLEQMFPLGNGYIGTFLSNPLKSGYVLQIVVHKSRSIIKASNGTPYIRKGAQNLPVDTPEAVRILERNKGVTSFENELLAADTELITNSEVGIKFMLDVIPTAEPEAWMRKQQLIQNEKPTVCGVLLFADLPQATLPKRCGIKVYRYQTDKAEGSRETLIGIPISLEGCTYDLIRNAVAMTKTIINELSVLGPEGPMAVQYPPEALHEVITNAVIHRDYYIADDVHIRIFENRVEVESPGRLPGHITPSNILTERLSRNGNLVRLINKFPDPPNKDVGEGLNTAFAAMKRLSLRDPIIEERENSVVVNIRHERLASAEIVLAFVKQFFSRLPFLSSSLA
ncbi:MAG: RNA-binding domain-containing protein [Spirochaetia bacterium]|jgi:ATP-dependent DNA helicase RecG